MPWEIFICKWWFGPRLRGTTTAAVFSAFNPNRANCFPMNETRGCQITKNIFLYFYIQKYVYANCIYDSRRHGTSSITNSFMLCYKDSHKFRSISLTRNKLETKWRLFKIKEKYTDLIKCIILYTFSCDSQKKYKNAKLQSNLINMNETARICNKEYHPTP